MFKETSFKNCFVNGTPAGVASYNEDPKSLLLYFGSSLGESEFDIRGRQAEVKAAGGNLSLHQFTSARVLSTPDAAGIQALIPGAVVYWEGSKEYAAEKDSRRGSRGGKTSGGGRSGSAGAGAPAVDPVAASGGAAEAPDPSTAATGAPSSAPAVVSADAFKVPAVSECSGLASVLGLMPQLAAVVESWSAGVASAVLEGSELPEMPSEITGAAALVPSLADHIEIYKNIITRAADEHKDKLAAVARAEAERLAALEAAKRAAESGKTLVTLADGSTVEVTGKVHPAFSEVCEDLKEFRAVYLQGPAGTGKSFMCRQLAEALGVPFESTGKAELKYDLVGSYDANGNHISTGFSRAWIHGGVWLADEFDRWPTEAGTCINDALANGVCEIPGLGMVERNENFYCVAAGNTYGFGPDPKYNAAQKQDYSVLTRFLSKIHIGYCREMDEIVTGGDSELCDFAAAVRAAIAETGIEIDLAIRQLKPLQTKAARRGCVRALECCLFAGLDKTAIRQIAKRVAGSGKWFDALKELAA